MLRRNNTTEENAQIFLEYVLVISAIVLIMFAMSTMIKRGSQGMIKIVADQIGNQINAEQTFDDSGYLESSTTTTRSNMNKTRDEILGDISFTYDDTVESESTVVINMGYTEGN